MSEYLPPVVAEILGDSRDLIAKLTEAKAALAALAKDRTSPVVDANIEDLRRKVAISAGMLAALNRRVDATIGANDSPLLAKVAEAKAALDALNATEVRPRLDGSALAAEAAAAGASRGRLAGFLAGLFGANGGNGGGKGGGGLAAAFGFGGGASKGIFGFGAGLAGAGSLGSLLGFGPERILGLGLGVAGSAAGGLLGGGLLGLGSLGVMGVGMGTDAAGIGQAANDIRAVVQAQNALAQAVAVYGANSRAAQAAQGRLNDTLSSFSPIARGAVSAAAATAQGFHQMFNAATGAAEKVGAEIINQAMKVGEKFLPTIGKFAAQNMGIIQRDIQPLFAWLDNPGKTGGLGIFTNLEKIFQGNLPTAIHAVTQGIELFANTVNVAAGYTGGFIRAIDRFLTHMNTPAGFAKWSVTIGHLIGDFRTWLRFIGEVGKVLVHLFGPAVGAGQAFIAMLTRGLTVLDSWLTKASTRNGLHNMFTAHLGEVIALIGGALSAMLPVLEGVATAFIALSTVAATIATAVFGPIIKAVGYLTHLPFASQVIAWGGGFLILRAALGPLLAMLPQLQAFLITIPGRIAAFGSSLAALPGRIAAFGSSLAALPGRIAALVGSIDLAKASLIALQAVGILAVAAGVVLLIQHFGVIRGLLIAGAAAVGVLTVAFIALDTVPLVVLIVGIGLALAGLVAGLILLAKHWSTVWHGIEAVAKTVWKGIEAGAGAIASFLTGVWHGIESVAKTVWNAIASFFKTWWPLLLVVFTGPIGLLTGMIVGHWHAISTVTKTVFHAVASFLTSVWHGIEAAITPVLHVILAVVGAAWHGVQTVTTAVFHAVLGVARVVWNAIESVVVTPARQMLSLVTSIFNHLSSAVSTGLHAALGIALSVAADFVQVGEAIVHGIVQGIENLAGAVGSAISSVAHGALGFVKGVLGIHSPSTVFADEVGAQIPRGVALGISENLRYVEAAVSAMARASLASAAPSVMSMQSGAVVGGRAITYAPNYQITMPATASSAQMKAEMKAMFDRHDADLIRALRAL